MKSRAAKILEKFGKNESFNPQAAGMKGLSVDGKSFYYKNDPGSGKLDLFDKSGAHIGQAPDVKQAEIFLAKEIKSGNL